MYSGSVLFILIVVCSSIPVPRKENAVKDFSQKASRGDHVYYTNSGPNGVQAPSTGLISGKCHFMCAFCFNKLT